MNRPITQRLKRWRRVARILFGVALGAFVLLLGLLHGVAWMFSLHDREMKQFPSRIITDSFGHTLRCFEVTRPNAKWNILFIHGTPGTAAVFREQFLHSFPNANLIALDRPGFGSSLPARRWPSLEDQVNALSAFLPTNSEARTVLIGHSYGGPIALAAALQFTNQIAGVILIGGSIDPAQEHPLAIQRLGDWPAISWLLPSALRNCNRELLTLRGDLLRLQPRIASLAVPIVMLHGGKDREVPIANVAYLREQLAAVGKTNLFHAMIFPAYNHYIPWKHPATVDAALSNLTQQLESNLEIR